MARYTKIIYLDQPSDVIEEMINEFILQNQFHETIWKGESCWAANQPIGKNIRYFQYAYNNGILRLEAWLRDGKTGEMGLSGFASVIEKASYLPLLENFIKDLLALLPEDSILKEKNREIFNSEKKAKRMHQWMIPLLALIFSLILADLFFDFLSWFGK